MYFDITGIKFAHSVYYFSYYHTTNIFSTVKFHAKFLSNRHIAVNPISKPNLIVNFSRNRVEFSALPQAKITAKVNPSYKYIFQRDTFPAVYQTAKLPCDNSIELKNVRFAYHDKEVLHGIDLHIEQGTVNALVGPSGSGKSTIARLIASLWDVKDGVIELGGVDIRTLPLAECTKRIANVSQDNYLFDLSVMDNIRMGRKGATDEEVIDAAKKCGCHEFIMSLENGYQTVCSASGGHLSGGERQRISIARAIMKDAPIIILDEATANVDPKNEKELMEAVSELTHDKTVIMIAHRLKTVRNADCIFVVDHGEIVQQGTHDELMAVDGLYRRFVVERKQAAGWKI